jgi:hypothetical protein
MAHITWVFSHGHPQSTGRSYFPKAHLFLAVFSRDMTDPRLTQYPLDFYALMSLIEPSGKFSLNWMPSLTEEIVSTWALRLA